MIHINKLIPGGRGLASVLLKRAAHVELGWDLRQKSRFEAVDSDGRPLGVFLARGSVVRGGDVLVAEDGSLIVVRAAAQQVLQVRHCAEHGSPFDLLRAAYHLGNRHVSLQLAPDHLALEPDPVVADMLRRQHLIVAEALAPFEPESGAYAAVGTLAHAHDEKLAAQATHDHGHPPAGGHAHAHTHGPSHGHRVAHVHGPGCSHAHGDAHAPGHPHEH